MALVASATAIYQPAKAQVSLQINIGSQPNWGPRGYDHVDYYYLPEVESYYNVPTRQFVYLERNKWVHRKSLPNRYRNYDLYQGRKIVINQPQPYLQHHVYQANYSRPTARHNDNRNDGYKYDNRRDDSKYDNRRDDFKYDKKHKSSKSKGHHYGKR